MEGTSQAKIDQKVVNSGGKMKWERYKKLEENLTQINPHSKYIHEGRIDVAKSHS